MAIIEEIEAIKKREMTTLIKERPFRVKCKLDLSGIAS